MVIVSFVPFRIGSRRGRVFKRYCKGFRADTEAMDDEAQDHEFERHLGRRTSKDRDRNQSGRWEAMASQCHARGNGWLVKKAISKDAPMRAIRR